MGKYKKLSHVIYKCEYHIVWVSKYRLESAYTTLKATRVLTDNGFWNSAVNSLYFAGFK